MNRKTVNLLSSRARRRSKDLLKEARRAASRTKLFLRGIAGLFAVAIGIACATQTPAMAAATTAALGVGFSGMLGIANSAVLGIAPRSINYLTGLQGVGASQVATINVPVNRRYHSIRILTTNAAGVLTDPTTIASRVELVVNSNTIRSAAPATFINLAAFYGITAGTGEIPIFFSEPWRNESPRAMEATSWDLFGQATFTIRITFLAPGGGVGVQSILADYDLKRNLRMNRTTGKEEPFLAIVTLKDHNQALGAGDNDVTTIPKDWPIQRLFLDVSANAIASVEVTADGSNKVWEGTNVENDYMLAANGLVPASFQYAIPFDYDNRIQSSIATSNLNLRINTTGALTLTAHVCQMVNAYRC